MNTARKLELEYAEDLEAHLQGNLQNVFDALYQLGVIDPVLEMDWVKAMETADLHRHKIDSAISTANNFQNSVDALMRELKNYDEETLGYLAMEVAREFADFHSREELH